MPAIPSPDDPSYTWLSLFKNGDGKGKGSLEEWSSLIGIVTAIVGNVLIAVALNVQRYTHTQLQKRGVESRERARNALRRANQSVAAQNTDGYGAAGRPSAESQRPDYSDDDDDDDDDDDATETNPLLQSYHSGHSVSCDSSEEMPKTTTTYLRSPSWWLGQVLMTVGEMGNFLAYGFAPASIVSPLGVVALVSNCVIAPLFFGEQFRKRDFWGVVIAVAGAVTVVLSAKQEETKLEPHDVWDHITTTAFQIYLLVTISFIVILMWASPKYGHRTILIDLGLVGLFGGYTALSTKGVSSMLSSTLFKAFTTPMTYGLLVVLLATAVMQVRYVNKALQRFDSTQVIPIQFVLFTLSVIIGSAVLYRDFERTNATQAVKFVGGCLLTFFGVFLITSGRAPSDDDDQLSDDEDIEETIGLTNQENSAAPTPSRGTLRSDLQQQPASTAASRRSSQVSRNGPSAATLKPSAQYTLSRPSLVAPAESSPLLTQWRKSNGSPPVHPGLPPTVTSADSVTTLQSSASVAVTEPAPSSKPVPPSIVEPPFLDRPTTPPRPGTRSHNSHYSNNFISPSPLSSTVSAVVADAMSRGDDGTLARKRSMRRMRGSIRSSLFVPNFEDISGPASSEPQLAGGQEGETTAPDAGQPSEEVRNGRRRAQSLGNTLEGFFGRKKKRRNTTPEAARSPNISSATQGEIPGPIDS